MTKLRLMVVEWLVVAAGLSVVIGSMAGLWLALKTSFYLVPFPVISGVFLWVFVVQPLYCVYRTEKWKVGRK